MFCEQAYSVHISAIKPASDPAHRIRVRVWQSGAAFACFVLFASGSLSGEIERLAADGVTLLLYRIVIVVAALRYIKLWLIRAI
jgi:hypothetical protein